MTPPPHPVLEPYLTASHLSAVDSYYAGPGVRTKTPTSLSGVKKAKKTRAAYISRLRRAAYMKMLEEACEKAYHHEKMIASRLEAERKDQFALLQGIRALQDEISEQAVVRRKHFGAVEMVVADFEVPEVAILEELEAIIADFSDTEVIASDLTAAKVVAADFRVAEVAGAVEAKKDTKRSHASTDFASMAEWDDGGFKTTKKFAAKEAELFAFEFSAAQVNAADFAAADVVASDFDLAEEIAAEEADREARERSGGIAPGSWFAPQILEDVDLWRFDERYVLHC